MPIWCNGRRYLIFYLFECLFCLAAVANYHFFLPSLGIEPRLPAFGESTLTTGLCCQIILWVDPYSDLNHNDVILTIQDSRHPSSQANTKTGILQSHRTSSRRKSTSFFRCGFKFCFHFGPLTKWFSPKNDIRSGKHHMACSYLVSIVCMDSGVNLISLSVYGCLR